MKRYLSMFLIMLLLFPTTPLSVFANTLENTETMTTLEPTAYYALDGDFTDKTENNETGVPFRRFEEDVSDWGEVRDYTLEFHQEGRNQAVYFDGTTGVKLADNLITSDTYSYSLWLKQTGEIGDFTSALFTGVVGRRAGISPAIGDNGELLYQVENAQAGETGLPVDYQFVSLSDSHQPYEWNNFVVTVDQGDLSLYLNGAQVAELANVLNIYEDLDSEYLLGFNPFPDPYYVGYMDEVMFFDDQALTAEQIEGYYHSVVADFRSEEEPNEDDTEDPAEEPEEGESGGDQAEDQDQQPSDEVIANDIVPSLPKKPLVPDFKNVSVHDPSIIFDNNTFYVFGSHLASAKSNDLIQWEQMTTEVSSDNPLFEDVFKELKEVFDWAETDTLWAADVIQLEDGRYYMYYNACRGDSPLSAMGLAVSDTVEGPYEDLGLFLWSGKTPNPMGIEYNIDIHPNAVDPAVFFDNDGQLWMVYGSYSGGIFILEMDNETGLPKEENSYGKLLTGGGVRIEASYMQYIPETGYYYLYTTFGGLDAIGGYNMRISRSKNPDGPFVDISGQNMIDAKGRPGIPFDDEAIEPYGLKLNGNFRFSNLNAVENYPVYGYVSPGHNSSYYDSDTGEHFSLFHTRFPHRGEEHEVRVHLMPMNKDGWPLMAPHRYAGESVLPVDIHEIPGTYHFVNHGDQISADINNTQYIELNTDGSITGEVEGSWKLDGEHYSEIIIDGVTYNGVFLVQWDETEQDFVMTFTAASNEGHSIWGSQFESVSDQEFVNNVLDQLSLGNLNRVYSDIQLPSQTVRGVTLDWTSSDETIISNSGVVNRPNAGAGNEEVTLTVSISYNGLSKTKAFEATVIEKVEDALNDGLVAHYPFNGSIKDRTGNFDTPRVTGDMMNIFEGEIDFSEGAVGQALYLDGTTGLHLGKNLIQNHDYSVAMWLKPEELRQFATAFFGMKNDDSWTSFLPMGHDGTTMLWSGTDWYDASTNLTISENEWTHLAYTVKDGGVKIYLNGEVMYQGENFPDIFTGTNAEFSLGVNLWDQPYKGLVDDLRIYAFSIEQDVIEQLLVASPEVGVDVHSIQLSTSHRNVVMGSTYQANATVYPINAEDRSITWRSDNPAVATVDPVTGIVKALDFGEATITASANDGSGTEASFVINVTDGKVAHYTFEDDLSDSLGISDAGSITGDRITNTNGQVSYSDGISGQALVFDGKSGVRLPNGLISSPTYSVSLWLNPSEITRNSTTFFGARNETNWVSFVPGGWDQDKTMLWSGSQQWYDAVADFYIPTNEWTHVTFTVDNGTTFIYVNGEVVFEGSNFPNIFSTNNAVFSLGVNYWDLPFKGMMDELIIYDGYALSEDEIVEYYSEIVPSKPVVEDEIIVDDFTEEFIMDSEANGGKVYVAKKPAKAYVFKKEALQGLDDAAQIEVTDDDVRVRIPVEIIRESGQSEVRFEMTNVTEKLETQINSEKENLQSELISFSLKDENGDAIEFDSIDLYFEIDLDKVDNIDNLSVIYFNNEGEEDTDHDAKIIDVNKVTGEVIVRVRHFSTYGIVELLDDSDVDDQEPDLPDDQDDQGANDGSDSGENDQGANDGSDSGEGDQGTDDGSDSGEGNLGSDDSSDSGEDNQDSDVTPDTDGEDDGSGDEQVETDQDAESDDEGEQSLPKTATNLYNMILLGFMFVLIGGGMFIFRKRKFES